MFKGQCKRSVHPERPWSTWQWPIKLSATFGDDTALARHGSILLIASRFTIQFYREMWPTIVISHDIPLVSSWSRRRMRVVDDIQWSVSRAIGPRAGFHVPPSSLLGLVMATLSLTRYFESYSFFRLMAVQWGEEQEDDQRKKGSRWEGERVGEFPREMRH